MDFILSFNDATGSLRLHLKPIIKNKTHRCSDSISGAM